MISEKRDVSSKPRISLIVPIYNTMEYLEKCLDSIIGQSYSAFQIILVDDGSTDGSGIMCDRYAQKDKRITVVHQKNAGLVNARKSGLRVAVGDYIYYVDSDDWIDHNMIESFMNVLSQHSVDMISIGIKREYEDSEYIIEELPYREGLYDREQIHHEMIPKLIRTDRFFDWGQCLAYWHFLVRKEILSANQQLISDSIRILEDVVCIYPCILDSTKIYVRNDVFYHYRQRNNSMKHKNSTLEYKNLQLVYRILMGRFQNEAEAKLLEKKAKYLLMFIMFALDIGEVEVESELCLFEGFPRESKIVIYGAGIYGMKIISLVNEKKYAKVVAWMDKNYEIYRKRKMEVDSPEKLTTLDYDYIILAVIRADIREEIRAELKKRGVPSSKIIEFDMIKIDEITLPKEFI